MASETTSQHPLPDEADLRVLISPGEVGANIKRARRAAGLTQEQTADQLGIHPTTYQKWETGDRVASWPKLAKLSEILGTSPNEILSYKQAPDIERDVVEKLDPVLLGQALQAMAALAENQNAVCQPSDHNEENTDASSEFWTVMGRAFADIITLTLSGASSREAVLYLRGVDRGFRDPKSPAATE